MKCLKTNSEGAAYFSPASECRVQAEPDSRPAGRHSGSHADRFAAIGGPKEVGCSDSEITETGSYLIMTEGGNCRPQGLKPAFLLARSGTAEAVPLPKPFKRYLLIFLQSANCQLLIAKRQMLKTEVQ